MSDITCDPITLRRRPTEWIELCQSAGRTSAGTVMVYPPGIPDLMSGETITVEKIAAIITKIKAGAPVEGLRSLGRIEVTLED